MITKKLQWAKEDAGPGAKKFHGVTSEKFHLKSSNKTMIASASDCHLIVVFCANSIIKWQDGEDDFLKAMY